MLKKISLLFKNVKFYLVFCNIFTLFRVLNGLLLFNSYIKLLWTSLVNIWLLIISNLLSDFTTADTPYTRPCLKQGSKKYFFLLLSPFYIWNFPLKCLKSNCINLRQKRAKPYYFYQVVYLFILIFFSRINHYVVIW